MRKLHGFKSVLKNKAEKSIMRTLERAVAVVEMWWRGCLLD